MTSDAQHFSHTSSVGFISFYVNFCLPMSFHRRARAMGARQPCRRVAAVRGALGMTPERVSDAGWSLRGTCMVLGSLFPSPPQCWSQRILISPSTLMRRGEGQQCSLSHANKEQPHSWIHGAKEKPRG